MKSTRVWSIKLRHAVGVLILPALLTGCSTTSMKGTPFYTGEYRDSEGPAADRVNLWPLMYYRDPALSVLWPLMEFSPDHLALRPVCSVYGRTSDTPVYNVVWPIARFDTGSGDKRIFPIYWGEDYFTAFPLYWHSGHPWSAKGYDALFPLWIYSSSGSGTSTHVMWPLYARFDHAYRQGWRLWPLYGMNDRLHGMDRWWLAGLGYRSDREDASRGWMVPLYAYESSTNRTAFYSLPYSRSLSSEPGGRSWDLALPLWHRTWEGTTNRWAALPVLTWGSRSPEYTDTWYAAGLLHRADAADAGSHHVLPLYYSEYSPKGRAFYSLPWWSQHRADGSGWNALFPLCYNSWSTNSSVLVTPFYARKMGADGEPVWNCFIPLVYFDHTRDAHFMTLLGGAWHDGEASQWIALPLLSGGTQNAGSGRTVWLAGLAGRKWDPEHRSHYLFPFYYASPTDNRFESLLYARRPAGTGVQRDIPILLSGWRADGDVILRFVLLGTWLSESRDGVTTKSHLIPFYIWQRDRHLYTALFGYSPSFRYYGTPIVGSYTGIRSGSWFWPVYRHRRETDGSVDGRYLLLGSYSKGKTSLRHRFRGIYNYRNLQHTYTSDSGTNRINRTRSLNYLLIGADSDTTVYADDGTGRPGEALRRRSSTRLFPLFSIRNREDLQTGEADSRASWLLSLYDSRTELAEEHDYVRRRFLWRVWYYEKLNGDASTDIFPGITHDVYANGYRKTSLLWRLFRYEKDPSTGRKEIDLLFIPLVRQKAP